MLNISRIRALTLDLDDTLWPIRPTIEHAERCLQQWLQAHAPSTAHLLLDSATRKAIRAEVAQQWAHAQHDVGVIRMEAIRLALRKAGDAPEFAEPAFAEFLQARMSVQLFDDALAALQWLAQRYPIIAVTNGNADVHRVGVGAYFKASVHAKDVGVGKPDPRIYQIAATRLGLEPSHVLHIGDDAVLDVLGAQRAGMQTVWVNRSQSPWQDSEGDAPTLTVPDLQVLCRHLQG